MCVFVKNTHSVSLLAGQRAGNCSSLALLGRDERTHLGAESPLGIVSGGLGRKNSLGPKDFQSWRPLKHRNIDNLLEENSDAGL